MTENQNGKIDPDAIRELISQGIPMKRKESEMKRSQSEEQGGGIGTSKWRTNIKGFFKSLKKRKAKVWQGRLWVAFHLSQHLEESQDHLYCQRVARHIGGDSHVNEKQRYDHRYQCGEYHPSSSWDLQGWNQQVSGDEVQETVVSYLAVAFCYFWAVSTHCQK